MLCHTSNRLHILHNCKRNHKCQKLENIGGSNSVEAIKRCAAVQEQAFGGFALLCGAVTARAAVLMTVWAKSTGLLDRENKENVSLCVHAVHSDRTPDSCRANYGCLTVSAIVSGWDAYRLHFCVWIGRRNTSMNAVFDWSSWRQTRWIQSQFLLWVKNICSTNSPPLCSKNTLGKVFISPDNIWWNNNLCLNKKHKNVKIICHSSLHDEILQWLTKLIPLGRDTDLQGYLENADPNGTSGKVLFPLSPPSFLCSEGGWIILSSAIIASPYDISVFVRCPLSPSCPLMRSMSASR